MLGDHDIERAASRVADFRRNDALSQILDDYSTLIEDYQRLKSDYEEERDAREKYKQMARGQERNPFVLVLVDGDGLVFHESLVAKGADGGTLAAQMLNERVKASLRRKGLEHCQIMVRIYANVVGLSKALSRVGLLGADKRSLAPFIASFNRSSGLADFVDAGELKENADFKLRELMRLYADNAQCKHIYFGGCHDVGYLSDLTPHMGNSGRFTLINAPSIRFHDEFTKLGMGIEDLDGVFRLAPLDGAASRPSNPSLFPNSKAATASPPVDPPGTLHSSMDGPKSVCRFHQVGRCKHGKNCRNLHVDDRARLTTTWRSSNDDTQSDTNGSIQESKRKPSPSSSMRGNADATSSNPVSTWQDILRLPRRDDIPERQIPLNKADFRLDPYLPQVASQAITRLNSRISKHRVCNNFHLAGFCENGDRCGYDHTPLEDECKQALESLARSMPCSRRGACRIGTCTQGHICQNMECTRRGGKAYCRLPCLSHVEDLAVAGYAPAVSKPYRNKPPSAANGGATSTTNADADGVSLVSPSWAGSDEDEEKMGFGRRNGATEEDDSDSAIHDELAL